MNMLMYVRRVDMYCLSKSLCNLRNEAVGDNDVFIKHTSDTGSSHQ